MQSVSTVLTRRSGVRSDRAALEAYRGHVMIISRRR
jgi:hypothetical protein